MTDIKHNEIEEYVRGTNTLLDSVYDLEDGPLWICNGSAGRKPILAASLNDAYSQYLNIEQRGTKEQSEQITAYRQDNRHNAGGRWMD